MNIKELEQQLAEAKKQELKEKWETYLIECKKFLDKINGKTILRWHRNGAFVLFKVNGYKEQYYIDRNGINGSWHPSRWFEVSTSGYLIANVADDRGNYFRPGIDSLGLNFKLISKKKNVIDISKFRAEEGQLSDATCDGDIKDGLKVGYTEYKDNFDEPQWDKSLQQFTVFCRIVPNEVLEKAIEIHKEHVIKTKQFWEEWEPIVKNSKPTWE